MADKNKAEIEEALSPEDVSKQSGRDISQIYNALSSGKLNEATLPLWVGKKGIKNDQKLKNYILNCRRLDENKKNKPIAVDPIKAAQDRLAKKQAKAARMAEQVKRQEERLQRMEKELTQNS